jgi:hypothetical protein
MSEPTKEQMRTAAEAINAIDDAIRQLGVAEDYLACSISFSDSHESFAVDAAFTQLGDTLYCLYNSIRRAAESK